ncbi:hypothetical protein Bca52824_023707 [Brassica carinata]|uniref:Mediator of RNA polymerase II transcription subunit 21 n=1 Tax=Brassica carinata TaxID=52824 RepID=A0A8X7VJL9_BRACI|nr:hypothetical protein Bca52824_023707 [Brassica carinata]
MKEDGYNITVQEQVNSIAAITFNAFGTLQRDAPPVQLYPNYPHPPSVAPTTTVTDDPTAAFPEQPKQLSANLVKDSKQVENDVVGQELLKHLEAAEKELKQVQEIFGQAADNCLNMKKPE